jgi:hypothetical protein
MDFPFDVSRLSDILRRSVTPAQPRHMLVMFHYGRCGSTVLGSQIGQHAEMFWEGELFEEMFRGRIHEHRLVRNPWRLLSLRHLYAGLRMYGLEVKYHPCYHLSKPILDLSPEACFGHLQAEGATHFIVLKRKNYLRQQISEEVGRQQNQWHRSKGEDNRVHSVTLDPECVRFGGCEPSLLESFRRRDAMYETMEYLLEDEQSLWLTFEDHIRDDPRVGYRKAANFLGLNPIDTQITTRRTNPHPIKDLLDNYGEVSGRMEGTPYEWMLTDG